MKLYHYYFYHDYVDLSPLYNEDVLRLDFMGSKGWLGCPFDICDLRICPTFTEGRFKNFSMCGGEVFQIVAEGGKHARSGYRVRFRYINGGNQWIGCSQNNRCDKRSCPGTNLQALTFTRCGGEILQIYARGRYKGDNIRNGDLVMLQYGTKFISIQGTKEGDDTSLTNCPGTLPLTYFDYSRCPKNVFRIYKKV